MNPIIAAAAIAAGTQLLGGLFGQKVAREQEEESRKLSGAQNVLGMTQSMLGSEQQASQSALSNLINAYRSGLGG